MLHKGFLEYFVCIEEVLAEFADETGYDLRELDNARQIDIMTGMHTEAETWFQFIVWVTEKYWGAPEYLEQLELYQKAKAWKKETPDK